MQKSHENPLTAPLFARTLESNEDCVTGRFSVLRQWRGVLVCV